MPNRGMASVYGHDVGGARGGGHGRQSLAAPCLPQGMRVRTESYIEDARLMPDAERPGHPARLVSDAIAILGRAQEEIRGKAYQRAVKKARGLLISMLEEGACTAASGGGGKAGRGGGNEAKKGRRRRRRRK